MAAPKVQVMEAVLRPPPPQPSRPDEGLLDGAKAHLTDLFSQWTREEVERSAARYALLHETNSEGNSQRCPKFRSDILDNAPGARVGRRGARDPRTGTSGQQIQLEPLIPAIQVE